MRVLVTGGAGYIGSVLVSKLLEEDYHVRVVDRLFFGRNSLKHLEKNPRLKLVQDDIRWCDPRILKNVDVVMDLASLSNDPSGELDPKKTLEINYKGRARIARLSKEKGVKRYILASSCSIYGYREGLLDEKSSINPITTYAKANRLAEVAAKKLADEKFTTTMLRFATVFGLSKRMRFDLAVNGMALGFFKNKKIPVMRNGKQWRPFIHIRDVTRAYIMMIKAPKDKINYEVFNVGSNELNYQVLTLAKEVARSIGIPFKKEWYGDLDTRSYKINFKKIQDKIGYKTKYKVSNGAKEVYSALKNKNVNDSIKTRTVDWYKHLIESKEILDSLIINNRIL